MFCIKYMNTLFQAISLSELGEGGSRWSTLALICGVQIAELVFGETESGHDRLNHGGLCRVKGCSGAHDQEALEGP